MKLEKFKLTLAVKDSAAREDIEKIITSLLGSSDIILAAEIDDEAFSIKSPIAPTLGDGTELPRKKRKWTRHVKTVPGAEAGSAGSVTEIVEVRK